MEVFNSIRETSGKSKDELNVRISFNVGGNWDRDRRGSWISVKNILIFLKFIIIQNLNSL